jgi:hypothetical protein
VTTAYLYGAQNPADQVASSRTAPEPRFPRAASASGSPREGVAAPGSTGGIGDLHAFFLLTDRPEVYNLPSAPTLPSTRVGPSLRAGLATVAGLMVVAAASYLFGGRD